MGIKNARTLGLRLDDKDSARLAKFEELTFVEGVSLARASLKAALNYWEEHGTLSLPLYISDKPPQAATPTQENPTKIIPIPTPLNIAAEDPDGKGPQTKQKVKYSMKVLKPGQPGYKVQEALENIAEQIQASGKPKGKGA